MSTINLLLPHECSQEDAVRCCSEWLTELARKWSDNVHGAEMSWDGTNAKYSLDLVLPVGNLRVTGSLSVTPTEVWLTGNYALPLMLSPFAASVDARVKSEIVEKWREHCASCPKHKSS
jgi:hypothetical protein